MFNFRLNKPSLAVLNFLISGIIYSALPAGFVALWVLAMQDNIASQEDIYKLVLFSAIIFLIGGTIGVFITLFRIEKNNSAIIGGVISAILMLGFFVFAGASSQKGMIGIFLFYVVPGCAAGFISGLLAEKLRKPETFSNDTPLKKSA